MVKLLLPPNNNIRIDAKSVYNLYLQLKNHFNGRRCVIKSDWRMKVSDDSFAKRKDKFFFQKLSEKFTLKELCLIFISNLVANQDAWIGEISDSDAVNFYKTYLARLRIVTARYEDDVKNIYYFSKKVNIKSLNDIFVYNESIKSSYIFKLLQSGIISFETFIMLDSFLNIIEEHDKHDNIIWSSYSVRLKAYRKLFTVDSDKCKSKFISSIKAAKF
ncbi:helicase loader [Acinetobacter phage AB-Navy71]|uniref:DNA helicase loader n=1 Tax=Acinetobacter phage AbTZA1 TaxID=2500827 RepID=A0A3T0IGQ9_9CAUD|nr:DNA helicase loader [Acinetobacter phage AbTZA1]AZU98600.1 DNA helicase loader [Acinetobacter phage AbTZA1]UQS94312.1 helicase loader [Acinetobacter phage AB-Navy71]